MNDSPRPDAPRHHLLPGTPPMAFLVEGSRLFEIDKELHERVAANDKEAERTLLDAAGVAAVPEHPAAHVGPPTSLSLNIAQACNLSCSYCYADEGRFGGRAELMPATVAFSAIERLLAGAAGKAVTLGFIGGEPLLNRPVFHGAVEYASRRARERGQVVRFSITTNGTLLTASDIDLLRRHRFVMSISLDGSAATNDANRKTHEGGGSWQEALDALAPLLRDPQGVRLAARATITRTDLRIQERIEALAAVGFREIGVSPVRNGPEPALALRDGDWSRLLMEMMRAGEAEFERASQGLSLRFSNLGVAIKQIHQGSARRLPCGAGSNYVSVSAGGQYFTCHRTVGDARFALGGDPDESARKRFLASRDVEAQPECSSCWARYLCGGGCHAEVVDHGRSGCDYIRGWLEYCLRFYDRLLRIRPEFFGYPADVEGVPE
jgi:uncharacterized protein